MGLFSFLKSACSKLLSNKAEENDAVASANASSATSDMVEAMNASRAAMLKSQILGYGITVDNLDVQVDDEKVTLFGQVDNTTDKEKVILIAGNTRGISSVDDRLSVVSNEPEADFYEVKSGDTLSKISKHYYGDLMKYNVIFEANKPMLTSPDLIYPGQVLRIPKL
ncbi:MAG: peptidoglycan-binding protein LysM [Saprospiraceae bacterium]|nr:peptidoglycan-binding protein LysM [Saprospiraceae bacterium]